MACTCTGSVLASTTNDDNAGTEGNTAHDTAVTVDSVDNCEYPCVDEEVDAAAVATWEGVMTVEQDAFGDKSRCDLRGDSGEGDDDDDEWRTAGDRLRRWFRSLRIAAAADTAAATSAVDGPVLTGEVISHRRGLEMYCIPGR